MDYATEFSMDRRPRKRPKLAWELPQTHSKVIHTFHFLHHHQFHLFCIFLKKKSFVVEKSTVTVISKKLIILFHIALVFEENLEIGVQFIMHT